jgi:hypothetical protein
MLRAAALMEPVSSARKNKAMSLRRSMILNPFLKLLLDIRRF